KKLDKVDAPLREVLFAMLEEMEKQRAQRDEQVTKREFNELKGIVKELAEAQKRTQQEVAKLASSLERTQQEVAKLASSLERTQQEVAKLASSLERTQQEVAKLASSLERTQQEVAKLASSLERTQQEVAKLASSLERTQQEVAKLASSLERTQQEVAKLASSLEKTQQEVAKLAIGLDGTRREVGGLSRSVAYALENESYRHLPVFLKEKHDIEVTQKIIRTFVDEEEINIFAKARRDGKEVLLVGEAVLKLDDASKLKQVWRKVEAVKEEMGGEVVPIIVTHFAKPGVLERAQRAGILVVQSFEWI
ncbi:hypothetical protein M1N04_01025, partial [Peptococcaceae bacterium]|nr:hypothetical protein [Peptococcaceae bacterium]